MQRAAGAAFFIRIANAAIAYLSQIVMARWMGAFEYGVYVYVWTWVLLIGTVADLGFAVAAQHFIPRYAEARDHSRIRGFIFASRWVPAAAITLMAALAAASVYLLSGTMGGYLVFPLYLACLALPPYGMTAVQDGVARSFGWINLGLVPPFILRPLLLLAVMLALFAAGFALDAATAMLAAVAATWLTALGQVVVLDRRLEKRVPKAPRRTAHGVWVRSALPVLFANIFLFLISYIGVLLLQYFRSPNEIALYYAATKVTAIVAMVHFAITASATHKFAAFEAAGDTAGLAKFYATSTRWTFWPSIAAAIVVLALGKPLLWLFGHEFMAAYSLMFVMVAGLLVRSSIGPGEQLLNMVGQQRICAVIYAAAFAVNLVLCLVFIPPWGAMGAALAAAISIVVESVLLFLVVKSRIGIRAFVGFSGPR
jgi:O-antigen/teichoic acid export membrane protein